MNRFDITIISLQNAAYDVRYSDTFFVCPHFPIPLLT